MSIAYFIGIIIALIGMMVLHKTYKIKLLKRSNKDIVKTNSINKNENSTEKIEPISDSNETTSDDLFDIKIKTKSKKSKKIQQAKIEEKETSIVPEEIYQNITTKNKYLYEADNFGVMKKGVVLESTTYIYDKDDKYDEFTIN